MVGECREWTGARRSDGYGVLSDLGRVRRVHVIAWELANGPVPPGLNVLHHCDNPPCFLVEHLFVGTKKVNTRDMMAKGRQVLHVENLVPGYRGPVGPGHHSARMTTEKVVEARALYRAGGTQRELAQRFGVTQSSMWALLTGKTWKHVEGGGAQ
jgi:hypothetical protein